MAISNSNTNTLSTVNRPFGPQTPQDGFIELESGNGFIERENSNGLLLRESA